MYPGNINTIEMSFNTEQESATFSNYNHGNNISITMVLTRTGDSVMCRLKEFAITKDSKTNIITLTHDSTAISENFRPDDDLHYFLPVSAGNSIFSVSLDADGTKMTLDFTNTGSFDTSAVPNCFMTWTRTD